MNKEHVTEHLEKKFEEDFKSLDNASEKEREFLQMIIGIAFIYSVFTRNEK